MLNSPGFEEQALQDYEGLRQLGDRAAQEGRLEAALGHLAGALEKAREIGDPDLEDRSLCNLTAVRIELNRADSALTELRGVLVRNSNPETCRLAAYSLARCYEIRKDHKKALFYARIARDHSKVLGRQDWLSSSHNQIANCLVAESFFDEAIDEYRLALEMVHEGHAGRRAVAEGNLGYCYVVRGNFATGMPLLVRSLRGLRRFGSEREVMVAHLDLCYAHLELGRHRWASLHGEKALGAAQRLGDQDTLKNALYLLGETANLLGDEEEAVAYFTRLKSHFPDTPFLVDFLMAIDVRKMINLRA